MSRRTSTCCWRRRTRVIPRRSSAAPGAMRPDTATSRANSSPPLNFFGLMWHGSPPCVRSSSPPCCSSPRPPALSKPPLRKSSRCGKRRAGVRIAARRTRAAPGLVVQEHPQSVADGVPAARRQGEWHGRHRRGGRRSSRTGVQPGRRRACAISRQPGRHRVRAEVPAVPRAGLEIHARQHGRRHPPRHAHRACARRRMECRSEAHRRHGLVGGRRSRGAGRLSTRRRRCEREGSGRTRERAARLRDPHLSRPARHSAKRSRRTRRRCSC